MSKNSHTRSLLDFDVEKFSKRVQARLEEINLTAAEAGRKAGLSSDVIRNIYRGKIVSPRVTTILSLSRILKVDPIYLMSGKDKEVSESQFSLVKRYDVNASAGAGSFVENESSIDELAFNRVWLKRRGLNPKDLSIVAVKGDSMEPMLKEGDLVLLDHQQREVLDGKIYVFRVEDTIYVKSLQKLPNGAFLVSSTNKFYDSYQIDPRDFARHEEKFEIIGRVVSSMNQW